MAGRRQLDSPDRRGPLRARGGLVYSPAIAGGLLVCVAVLALSASGPQQAQALPTPRDVVDTVTGLPGKVLSGAAGGALRGVLEGMFGGLQTAVTTNLITWLVRVPAMSGGHVGGLEQTVQAAAFGLLGAVMTISVIRYWVAGLSLSGAGGFEAIEGLTRTMGAVLLIVLWPWLFKQGVSLVNTLSYALLHSGDVQRDLTQLVRAATVGSFMPGVGMILAVIVVTAGVVLLLALVLMKVVFTAATAFLFAAMPLAIVLWPISELSWIARYALRTITVMFLAPTMWVLIFAAFAALGTDTLSFDGGGGVLDKAIIKPLAGIALLYVAVTVPLKLLQAATLGAGPGGGFAARIGGYVSGRMSYNAIARHVPAALGGTAGGALGGTAGGAQVNSGALRRVAGRGSGSLGDAELAPLVSAAGQAIAGRAAWSGGAAAGVGAFGRQQGLASGQQQPRMHAAGHPVTATGSAGRPDLNFPPFSGPGSYAVRVRREQKAMRTAQGVTASDVAGALQTLGARTAHALAAESQRHETLATPLARLTALEEISDSDREGLRTVGSASPEALGHGMSMFFSGQPGDPAGPPPRGPSDTASTPRDPSGVNATGDSQAATPAPPPAPGADGEDVAVPPARGPDDGAPPFKR